MLKEEIHDLTPNSKKLMLLSFLVHLAKEESKLSMLSIGSMILGLLTEENINDIIDNLDGDSDSLSGLLFENIVALTKMPPSWRQ